MTAFKAEGNGPRQDRRVPVGAGGPPRPRPVRNFRRGGTRVLARHGRAPSPVGPPGGRPGRGSFHGPFSIVLQDGAARGFRTSGRRRGPAGPASAVGLHCRLRLGIYSRQMNSFPTNDRRPLWRRVVSDEIPETVTAQIGRNILLRRTALGMLQGELAQKAGMSQAHLSNIEQGKRSLTVEVLAVFANVLDCEMADLLPASRAGKRAA